MYIKLFTADTHICKMKLSLCWVCEAGSFFTGLADVSFSRRTLFHIPRLFLALPILWYRQSKIAVSKKTKLSNWEDSHALLMAKAELIQGASKPHSASKVFTCLCRRRPHLRSLMSHLVQMTFLLQTRPPCILFTFTSRYVIYYN
jgi:hypothetical protein